MNFADVLTALGLMAVIEGLVLALAPLRFEQLLEALRSLTKQQLRMIALVVIAGGVGTIWIAQNLG